VSLPNQEPLCRHFQSLRKEVTQHDVISKGLVTKKRKDSFVINVKYYNAEGIFKNDLYCLRVKTAEQRSIAKTWP
jgi:hypothetical protein